VAQHMDCSTCKFTPFDGLDMLTDVQNVWG